MKKFHLPSKLLAIWRNASNLEGISRARLGIGGVVSSCWVVAGTVEVSVWDGNG